MTHCQVELACQTDIEVQSVYSTNRAVIPDDVGRRLENLFWRIWSSDRILHRIKGRLVSAVFTRISEGGYIRTTPTQSPRASRSLGAFVAVQDMDPSSTDSADPVIEQKPSNPEYADFETAGSSSKNVQDRPTSILKKSKSGSSGQLSKSARILTPTFEASKFGLGDVEEDDVSLDTPSSTMTGSQSGNARNNSAFLTFPPSEKKHARPSKGATVQETSSSLQSSSTGKPMVLQDSSIPKQGRRKQAVVTSRGPARKRPIMRHGSSQSSSGSTSNLTTSSQSRTNKPDGVHTSNTKDVSFRSMLPKSDDSSSNRKARSSKKNQGTVSDDSLKEQDTDDGSQDEESNSGGQLVDPNFRANFAERTRSAQQSFTSIASITSKSSPTTGAAASYQASGTLDFGPHSRAVHKSKVASGYMDKRLQPTRPDASKQTAESDISEYGLPRSKSQLTLLLEKNRKTGDETRKAKSGKQKDQSYEDGR